MAKPEIDLDVIKQHLRIDHDLDDELLEEYAETALEVAQQHIGKVFGENNTSETVKFTKSIKVGCLMYIGHLYANREMTVESMAIMRVIPMSVESLWNPYREPAIY